LELGGKSTNVGKEREERKTMTGQGWCGVAGKEAGLARAGTVWGKTESGGKNSLFEITRVINGRQLEILMKKNDEEPWGVSGK